MARHAKRMVEDNRVAVKCDTISKVAKCIREGYSTQYGYSQRYLTEESKSGVKTMDWSWRWEQNSFGKSQRGDRRLRFVVDFPDNKIEMEVNKRYVRPLTENHEIWQSCFVRKIQKGQQKISDSDSTDLESDMAQREMKRKWVMYNRPVQI